MEISYRWTQDFEAAQLEDLFLSVEWESGNYPERLKAAMANCSEVVSAWDGGMLVGLMNAMGDGGMNVYYQYLLVRPDYQGRGIGRSLVERMLERHQGYLRKTLLAYKDKAGFYESCGFKLGTSSVPMSHT